MVSVRARCAPPRFFRSLEKALLQIKTDGMRAGVKAADSQFCAVEKKVFRSEGGVATWAPLNEDYQKRKDAMFARAKAETKRRARDDVFLPAHYAEGRSAIPAGPNKILSLWGVLRKALTEEGGGTHPKTKEPYEHIATATANAEHKFTIRLGAQGPVYFKAHAEGTDKMVARPPIVLTEEDVSKIRSAFSRGVIPHAMRAAKIWAASEGKW